MIPSVIAEKAFKKHISAEVQLDETELMSVNRCGSFCSCVILCRLLLHSAVSCGLHGRAQKREVIWLFYPTRHEKGFLAWTCSGWQDWLIFSCTSKSKEHVEVILVFRPQCLTVTTARTFSQFLVIYFMSKLNEIFMMCLFVFSSFL